MASPLEIDTELKRIAADTGTEVRGFWRAVIDDPRVVPACYRREMLDKQAIAKDMQAGVLVPGARLEWAYIFYGTQREPDSQVSEQS